MSEDLQNKSENFHILIFAFKLKGVIHPQRFAHYLLTSWHSKLVWYYFKGYLQSSTMAVYSDHVCLLRSKNEKVKTSKRYHEVVSGSPMPIFLSMSYYLENCCNQVADKVGWTKEPNQWIIESSSTHWLNELITAALKSAKNNQLKWLYYILLFIIYIFWNVLLQYITLVTLYFFKVQFTPLTNH